VMLTDAEYQVLLEIMFSIIAMMLPLT